MASEKLNQVFSKMESLKVKPGVGIGNFELGMHVNEALKLVRESFLPERPLVDIVYSRSSPLSKPILIRVSAAGFQLHFDSVSQRLTLIEVSNFACIPLEYSGTTFTGPNVVSETDNQANFLQLYNLFGPTYPGHFNSKIGLYILKYRGLSFLFPIPEPHQKQYKGTSIKRIHMMSLSQKFRRWKRAAS